MSEEISYDGLIAAIQEELRGDQSVITYQNESVLETDLFKATESLGRLEDRPSLNVVELRAMAKYLQETGMHVHLIMALTLVADNLADGLNKEQNGSASRNH